MQSVTEIYDKKKRGACISWGSEHTVFLYDTDKVIKFSLADFLLCSNEKTLGDYEICKGYLGNYLLDTHLVFSSKQKYVATVQKKIEGHYLSKEDFISESIKHQFKEILIAHDKMLQAGHGEIDLVGSGGILRNRLSNIFVIQNNQLCIIDATFLEIKGQYANPVKYIFYLIIRPIALWRQHSTIRKFKKLSK